MIMAISESQLMRQRIHDLIDECVATGNTVSGDGASSSDHTGFTEDQEASFTETGTATNRRWVMESEKRHNGQVIIPMLPDGRVIVMVRYRPTAKKWLVGFPSGFGVEGEDNWRDTAERMLLNDLGVTSSEMFVIGGTSHHSCQESNNFGVILANKCSWNAHSPVANDGGSKILEMSFDCLENLIGDGEIECSLTLSALMTYHIYRKRSGPRRG